MDSSVIINPDYGFWTGNNSSLHVTGNVEMDKLIRCLVECHSQILVYKSMEINDGSGILLFGQSFV